MVNLTFFELLWFIVKLITSLTVGMIVSVFIIYFVCALISGLCEFVEYRKRK